MSGRRHGTPTTGDGIELLHTAADQPDLGETTSPTEPDGGRSGLATSAKVAMGLGLAGIVVLLLALSRTGDGEPRALPPSTTGPDPATTIVDRDNPLPTTTTSIPVPRTTLVPGVYLLGEPTGYWLFFGGSAPLQRLDLDSGELVEFGIRAEPVETVGDHLVLYQPASDTVGWVTLEDPGQQALTWKRGRVRPSDEPDQLWVREERSADGDRWTLFDVRSNRLLERRPAVADALDGHSPDGRSRALTNGPDLISRPDGIYRIEADDQRRLENGRLLTYDADRALVERCETASGAIPACSLHWVDRRSWTDLEEPAPTTDAATAELVASGQWLRTTDEAGSVSLHSRDGEQTLGFLPDTPVAISPDGRWLAVDDGDDDRTTIIDLLDDQGGEAVLSFDWPDPTAGSGFLFVSKLPPDGE